MPPTHQTPGTQERAEKVKGNRKRDFSKVVDIANRGGLNVSGTSGTDHNAS